MSAPRTVKQVRGLHLRLGGEEHSGWLPSGAAPPPPLPVREAIVDVRIDRLADSGSACLLICASRNTLDTWDTWYETVEEAEEAAGRVLGIRRQDWQDVDL